MDFNDGYFSLFVFFSGEFFDFQYFVVFFVVVLIYFIMKKRQFLELTKFQQKLKKQNDV